MNREESKSIPKESGIYKITSPSGRVYIGQSKSLQQRYRDYLYPRPPSHLSKIYNSFQKYGKESHTFTVLEITKDLESRELFYIKKHNSVEEGLNTYYSVHSIFVSDETKKKMSKNMKENWTKERKESHSKRISELHKEGVYEGMNTEMWKSEERRQQQSELLKRLHKEGKMDHDNRFKFSKKMVNIRDTRDNTVKRVTKEEFDKTDHYVGVTSGMKKSNGKKVMLVETGEIFRSCGDCIKQLSLYHHQFYKWIDEGKIVYLSK
jgi:group I intron endonuclease